MRAPNFESSRPLLRVAILGRDEGMGGAHTLLIAERSQSRESDMCDS